MPKIIKRCVGCGSMFEVFHSEASLKNCSFACRKMRKKLKCKLCGKNFFVIKSQVSRRQSCSKKCYALWLKKHPLRYWLGKKRSFKTIEKIRRKLLGRKLKKSTIKKMIKSRAWYKHSPGTKEKLRISKIGERNPAWKGGRFLSDGYIRVSLNGKKIREHRLVMEKHLGRKLHVNELVHHINGNKEDNDIKNLKIMSRSEHSTHHNADRRKP